MDEQKKSSGDVESWVTIATFSWLQDALLLKGRLESEGLEANVPEEFTSTINPFATAMQVRVQVRSSHVEEARKLLLPEGAPGGEACPHCGSRQASRTELPSRNWFVALVGALFGVPVRGASRKVCPDCRRER